MRLFQLARKLNIKQESIVALLAEKGVEIENKSNTKLEESHTEMVMAHFAPTPSESTTGVETEREPVPEVAESIEKTTELVPEKPSPTKESREEGPSAEPKNGSELPSADDPSETEVIRVKKVKLSGPKVVGKIELPEPKPKPEKSEKVEVSKKGDKTDYRQGDRRRGRRPSRKHETLAQKRQREERKQARLRQEEEKQKKQKRAEYYKKHIQPVPEDLKPKSKKKKTVTEDRVQEQPRHRKRTEQHKNPFKRLWSWLNGEYDRY